MFFMVCDRCGTILDRCVTGAGRFWVGSDRYVLGFPGVGPVCSGFSGCRTGMFWCWPHNFVYVLGVGHSILCNCCVIVV